MKLVISQPRYLPAINYLSRLYFSDNFVLLDNVQRQPRGFENRNKLLFSKPDWLTIPIKSSSREVIYLTKIDGAEWVEEHKNKIYNYYNKAPYFDEGLLSAWYEGIDHVDDFTDAIELYLRNVCQSLNFEPKIIRATTICGCEKKSGVENICDLIRYFKSKFTDTIYISGSNGRNYGIVDVLKKENIAVKIHDWQPEPYQQRSMESFIPFLGFVDMAFSVGIEKLESEIRIPPELSNE